MTQTYDAAIDTMVEYFDGLIMGTWLTGNYHMPSSFDMVLHLGGNSQLAGLSQFFDGEMAEVIYESEAWSAAEISQYYNSLK